jgi:catechol 2,3-dioxygenase-like lactoylglutathione lyase family enzyme
LEVARRRKVGDRRLGSESAVLGEKLPAWRGWLREAVLAVPEPGGALEYYAQLLGGEVVAGAVELGSSTRLVVEEGAPGLRAAVVELLGGIESFDGAAVDDEGYLVDPENRRFRLEGRGRIEERMTDTRPRLGHLTFDSRDPVSQQRFFEPFGFLLSEGLGPNFRWLRCNPVHHTLAFSRAAEPRLHHVGIELPDRNAVIDACDRLAEMGHVVQYGPGRHMVGGNIFVYFLDRYGIRFELFCELERIVDSDRAPLIHENVPREKSINVWGPQPTEAFQKGVGAS